MTTNNKDDIKYRQGRTKEQVRSSELGLMWTVIGFIVLMCGYAAYKMYIES